jgi:hypothetical protein
VTVSARNLQENSSQVVSLAFVEIGIVSGGLQALFELGNSG